jgi:2-polyprenyl-3-methyl-5-hydroxy-6-metoxy-1,4-benzoquinol methylase
LDVGCGIGSYTALIDNENSYGIDLDVYAVKTAKKHCTRSNFLVASVLNLPFRDEIFDLIVMWEVIEHVPAKTEMQVLTELHRTLTCCGAMILSTPNNHFISKMMDPAFVLCRHRHYDTKKLYS